MKEKKERSGRPGRRPAERGKMEQHPIRPLKAEEIECRIAAVSEKGLSLLLYKDARVDQRILDETFGPFGWKRSHQCIDGNLYCTVEVRDRETGEWVAKQDVGTVSYSEKEKGQASDSFKRACFNWGIGRELYTAPFIWIPAGKAVIREKEGRERKHACGDRFRVASISYNGNREISGLVIQNDRGQTVYELKEKEAPGKRAAAAEKEGGITREQERLLRAELDRTGVDMEAVRSRYSIKKPEAMSQELYGRVMEALGKTRTAGAA